MSHDDDGDEGRPTYEVGYKRPPKQHRFKKGVPANPKGRPRRKTNFALDGTMDAEIAELILSEAGRAVSVRENGRSEDISIKKALLRTLNHSALKGDLRSQVEALKLILAAERLIAEQKVDKAWRCPKCSESEGQTSEELMEEIMELLDSGKVKLPAGYEVVVIDDDDEDPHGVG